MGIRTIAALLLGLSTACDDADPERRAPARAAARSNDARLVAALVGSRPVDPDVPWARIVDPVEPTAAPRRTAPTRRRDMVIDASAPTAAIVGEARGALLYLAMDGITLRPCDDPSEIANSAKHCTSLVEATTEVPAHGDDQAQAAFAQQVAAYFAAFDVTITTEQPPDYMPHTLQAVGGVPELVGESDICGIANLECGGAQRNRVGLVFADAPNCTPTKTAAHESGHDFGLEHTIDDDDIMSYTLVYDGLYSFRDACMPLFHELPDEQAFCGFTHRQFCPDGDGEQQNSRAELLAGLGPARTDDTAPQIVELAPADGSVFTTEDEILVGASVIEDGNFVGARWTWIDGLPDELPFGHDRCTNGVCIESFDNPMGDPDRPFDYLVLAGAPVGEYLFAFEVMDAHGNESVAQVRFEVVEPDAAPTTDAESESSGAPSEADDGTSEAGEPVDPDDTDDGDGLPPGFGSEDATASGCAMAGSGPRGWLACLLLVALRRSARRRACTFAARGRFSAPCGIVTSSAPEAPERSAARSPRRSCAAGPGSPCRLSRKRMPTA